MKNIRYSYLALLFLIYFFVSQLTRIILLFYTHAVFTTDWWSLFLVFILGLVNDILPFLLMTVPLAALILLPKEYHLKKRFQWVLCILFSIYVAIFLFTAVAEYLFWEEFYCRFNFIAVDYLIYTTEVVRNIIESYPVTLIVIAVVMVAVVVSLLLLSLLKKNRFIYTSPARWLFGLWVFFCIMSFFYTPPIVSKNFLIHELSSNGVWSLFSSFWKNQINYKQFYPMLDEHEAFNILRTKILEPDSKFINNDSKEWRRHIYAKGSEKKLNVIEIIVESLGKNALGEHTPYLNTLIKKSLYFSNMRATGTRTVRGIEALILSVPPTPGSAIVRRPNNQDLFTTGSVFQDKGYDTVFVCGGYGYFDNMNAFFSGNGFRIVDQAIIPEKYKTFSNAWGICDEDLMNAVLREADTAYALKKPFYQVVLTTSNHRPFTYPDGKIDVPSGSSRTGAIKYTDYALGRFLEEAKLKPWFNNTIFIIIADHTAGCAGQTVLPPESYEIPCIIYSPNHIPSQEIDVLCSQIDVAPTLFALLNWSYDSGFFGRDILTLTKEEGRAWISTYQLVGYMTDNALVILEPRKPPFIERFKPIEKGMLDNKTLEKITISMYQIVQELFVQGKLKK